MATVTGEAMGEAMGEVMGEAMTGMMTAAAGGKPTTIRLASA